MEILFFKAVIAFSVIVIMGFAITSIILLYNMFKKMDNFLNKFFELLTQNLELILGFVGLFATLYIILSIFIFITVLFFVIKRFRESKNRRAKFFKERDKILKGLK